MPLSPMYVPIDAAKGPPKIASATLTHKNMDGGQDATLNPPGFVGGGCPHHHQRGHLIGNSLGGKDDLRNLVTLTDGSNHPYMFAIERIVKRIVVETKMEYVYVVEVKYDDYWPTPNHTGFGALGNPHCQDPCPSHLFVSLKRKHDGFSMFSDVNTFVKYDDPKYATAVYMKNMVDKGRVRIQNGMYKQHSNTDKHQVTCPGLVSVKGIEIKCHVCGELGGQSAREPTFMEWTWPKTCWHWCMKCQLNWCPTHGGGLPASSWYRMGRQCSVCSAPTQLYALGAQR